MAQSPKARKEKRRDRMIRASRPGPALTKQSQMDRFTRINNEPVEIAQNSARGKSRISLDNGPYTYRAIPFRIVSDAAIAGETALTPGGQHVILTDHVSKYVDEISLHANGSMMQEYTTEELITKNRFHKLPFRDGEVGFHFPGEEMYRNGKYRDLFALGTGNLRDVKLVLKQTAAFDDATMQIECFPHYVMQQRPATFVNTTERIVETFAGVGKHTFKDLPDGDDIQSIWMIADGDISHVKVDVDGEVLIDCHIEQYYSYLSSMGRDVSVLGDQWFIDFHAEGEPQSLAALDMPMEVRRGAKIKIDLTTTQASTTVQFLTNHVGAYHKVK